MWFTTSGVKAACSYRFRNGNLLQNKYDETDFTVNKNKGFTPEILPFITISVRQDKLVNMIQLWKAVG
jgi:hypothetical protein